MNNIIVGMGEALWDVLPEGKKIGGAPANFAYHVSQFGFDSRVVSAVGKDELGDEILNVFNEKKLKTQIEQVDYPTGTVQVTLDNEGVPCYEIKEGVAWDNIPFTDELKRLALSTRAVCFGSLAQRNEVSRATINRFLDTMPDIDGQLKIFDINKAVAVHIVYLIIILFAELTIVHLYIFRVCNIVAVNIYIQQIYSYTADIFILFADFDCNFTGNTVFRTNCRRICTRFFSYGKIAAFICFKNFVVYCNRCVTHAVFIGQKRADICRKIVNRFFQYTYRHFVNSTHIFYC